MIKEVALHMILEGMGAVGLQFALGFCHHTHHRIMIWVALALISSLITVHLVG